MDAQQLIYRLSKPRPDGRTELMLSPLEFIQRLATVRYPYYAVAGLTRYERPVLAGKRTFAPTVQSSDILVSLSKFPKPLSFHI